MLGWRQARLGASIDSRREVQVSRVHDVGGQSGFGPVPLDDDGQPFHADWEARVFALNAVLLTRGVYYVDEFRDAIERLPPADYLQASYYERRLRAMETLLAGKGIG
jgi:nitrile hydratase